MVHIIWLPSALSAMRVQGGVTAYVHARSGRGISAAGASLPTDWHRTRRTPTADFACCPRSGMWSLVADACPYSSVVFLASIHNRAHVQTARQAEESPGGLLLMLIERLEPADAAAGAGAAVVADALAQVIVVVIHRYRLSSIHNSPGERTTRQAPARQRAVPVVSTDGVGAPPQGAVPPDEPGAP